MEWLEGLNQKYVEHLVENLEHYPALNRKFGVLVGSSALYDMISQVVSSPVKLRKDEFGAPDPTSRSLPYRQKMYYRSKDGRKASPRCALDIEMAEKGFSRKHFPVFDRLGVEIPLQRINITRGDVISVQSYITCQLWDIGGNVGANLKRTIKSVTLLRAAEKLPYEKQFTQSPFAGLASVLWDLKLAQWYIARIGCSRSSFLLLLKNDLIWALYPNHALIEKCRHHIIIISVQIVTFEDWKSLAD